MRRIKDVQLVTPRDVGYSNCCEERVLSKMHLRERCEQHANSKVSAVIEDCVRRWLSTIATVPRERVLAFKGYRRSAGWIEMYRELDAVIGDSGWPSVFVEVKTAGRRPARKRLAGRAQLRSALAVARRRWPDIRGTVLVVSLLENGEITPLPLAADLVIAGGAVTVSATELWEFSIGDRSLLEDAIAASRSHAEPQHPCKAIAYSTGEFSKNAFQIAMERAGRK